MALPALHPWTLKSACYIRHAWNQFVSCKKDIDPRFAFRSASFLSDSGRLQHHPILRFTLGNSSIHQSRSYAQHSIPLNKLEMDAKILLPPPAVRGMTKLDPLTFQKKILVPHVTVKSSIVNSTLKHLKKYLLKLEKLKPVRTADENSEKIEILLNPTLMKNCEDIRTQLGKMDVEEVTCVYREITVGYENWKAEDILKAVLPVNQEGAQSYSVVGHILHLNLRDHLLPYKTLIGQVYLDKVPGISVVVNKLNNIDSTYRNFQMEVLGGTGETVVTVKENGCTYTLDFARVYWNPRLATEHSRVVGRLRHGDVLYDVMAGVGPFAIPAGRKKCCVLANDLNPDSFDALVKNCSRNKVGDRVKCFNMDGHDFITTVLKTDLLEKWEDPDFVGSVHITMNLPALAVTFLSSFQGLFHDTEKVSDNVQLPVVHVYMFTRETAKDIAIGLVAENLGYSSKPSDTEVASEMLQEGVLSSGELEVSEKSKSHRSYENFKAYIQEVVHVRQVAPNKAMMRVTVQLPLQVLLEEPTEPPCKKFKSSLCCSSLPESV